MRIDWDPVQVRKLVDDLDDILTEKDDEDTD